MQALAHIRRATELNPQSVAAWSLLRRLGNISQTPGRHGRQAPIIYRLLRTWTTSFLGWTRGGVWGTIESIDLLEKAIEMRDSALARAGLAVRLSSHAVWNTKDWSQMTQCSGKHHGCERARR